MSEHVLWLFLFLFASLATLPQMAPIEHVLEVNAGKAWIGRCHKTRTRCVSPSFWRKSHMRVIQTPFLPVLLPMSIPRPPGCRAMGEYALESSFQITQCPQMHV